MKSSREHNPTSILVDTSIWIDYFNKPHSSIGQEVEALIEQDKVSTTGIIIAELLQGAKDLQEFESLRDSLFSLPYLEETYETWEEVGKLSFELRKKGSAVPLSDCLIAILSQENDCPIYTRDNHFKRIPSLELYEEIK